MNQKISTILLILIISCSCSKAPSSTQKGSSDNISDSETQEQINYTNQILQKYEYINAILDFWEFGPEIILNTHFPLEHDYDKFSNSILYLRDLNFLKNELVAAKSQIIWFRDILNVSNLETIFTPDPNSRVYEFYLDLINVVGIYERPNYLIEFADTKLNAIYEDEEIIHNWMIQNKDLVESKYPLSDYWDFYKTLSRFNDTYKKGRDSILKSLAEKDYFKANSLITDIDVSFLFYEAMMSYAVTTIDKKEKIIEVRNEFNNFIKEIRIQLRSELVLADNSDQQLFYKLIEEIVFAKKQRDLAEEE